MFPKIDISRCNYELGNGSLILDHNSSHNIYPVDEYNNILVLLSTSNTIMLPHYSTNYVLQVFLANLNGIRVSCDFYCNKIISIMNSTDNNITVNNMRNPAIGFSKLNNIVINSTIQSITWAVNTKITFKSIIIDGDEKGWLYCG